jgi:hypothetical protein
VTDLVREEEWASLMRAGMAGDAIAYRQFLRSVTPHLRAVAHACQRSFGAGDGHATATPQSSRSVSFQACLARHLHRL